MNPIISLQESNDETLVQLYQQTSNTQIIGILYQRYAGQIKKHCMQYLKDEASSEDALMDIFEQLVQKLKMLLCFLLTLLFDKSKINSFR